MASSGGTLSVMPRRAQKRITAVTPCVPPPVISTRVRPLIGALAVGASPGYISDDPGSGSPGGPAPVIGRGGRRLFTMPLASVGWRERMAGPTAGPAISTSTMPISTGTQRGIAGVSSIFGSAATRLRLRVVVDLRDAVVGHDRVVVVGELVVLLLTLPQQIERALLVLGRDVDADVSHRPEVDRLLAELHVLDLRRNLLGIEEAFDQLRLIDSPGAGDLDPRRPLGRHGLERQLVDELGAAVDALGLPCDVLGLTRWTVRHSFSYGASVTSPPTPVSPQTFA